MYGLDSFLWIIGVLLLVAPVLAIVALVKTSNLRYEIARLHRILREMQTQLAQLRESPKADPEAEKPDEPQPAPAVPERTAPPERTVAETPKEPAPEEPVAGKSQMPEPPTKPPRAPAGRPPATGPFREKELAKLRDGLEERFVSRWLVPLAAIFGFLAIIYLYHWSVQVGWIGPTGQCLIGASIGALFILAGEVLRRHPWERAAAVVKPSLIPAACVSVGVSCLYVSVYAAYALFDLVPPIAAFFMMFVVWLLAMGLSILYGALVAALGILGGFLVPILVQTGHPSAYGLFPYILAVNGAALGVLRYKGWGWLAWCTLAGAGIWPVLWLVDQPAADIGAPVIGAYLTATAALFIYVPAGLASYNEPLTLTNLFRNLPRPAILAWTASSVMLVLALLLTWADGFAWGSVAWAGLLATFLMFAGRRDVTFDALSIGAAVMVGLVLLSWDLPFWPGEIDVMDTLPPGLVPFVLTAISYAGLFGVAGFGLLQGAARPGLWAGLSAGVPVVTLAIAYGRIKGFEVDLTWAVFGLLLGALCLGATMMVARQRGRPGMEGALAAYAVGVVASLSLAMAMSLENAWLTVALALQLPAIGWIHERTRVGPLRAVAMLLAVIILGRLVLNPEIFNYGLTAMPGLNWMFYGYGIPTIAFYVASRLFRRRADDALVLMLESGALVFLTLFATMEIADVVQQGEFQPGDSLLEASLRTIAWLTIASALLYQCRAEKPRVVAVWGWQILAVLSGGHVATVHLLGLNPLLTGDSVGSWWIANILLLAYLVPALFAILLRILTDRQGHPSAPPIAGVSALVLVFVWLTMEVRHAFHGASLDTGLTTDAEWWAYSVAWLIYAVLLLGLGVRLRNMRMRHASLAVVILTVLKAAVDIMEMRGLWLVGSLFGLMVFILGIAWVYRRYVFPPGEGHKQDGNGPVPDIHPSSG